MSRREWEEPIIPLDTSTPSNPFAAAGLMTASSEHFLPAPIRRELTEAAEYLELDPDEPATWERDLLRACDAVQRALVLVRSR